MKAYFSDSSDEANIPNFGSLFLITPILSLIKWVCSFFVTLLFYNSLQLVEIRDVQMFTDTQSSQVQIIPLAQNVQVRFSSLLYSVTERDRF